MVVGLSLLDPHLSELAWLLYKCVALWRAVYGASATESPLGTIREEKGIYSQFGYDLSC